MEQTDFNNLVSDMVTWGKSRIKRVIRMASAYGILLDSTVYSNGEKG